MAPVKRSTATSQRETRSTRSTTVAKKNAAAAEKKALSPIVEKVAAATKSASTTRKGRKAVPDSVDEEVDLAPEPAAAPKPKITRSRTAKPTAARAPTATTTTAARRRIKVTPLNSTASDVATEEPKSIRGRTKSSSATKVKPTALPKAADEVESEDDEKAPEAPKARSTRRAVSSREPTQKSKSATTASKTRSKPKGTIEEEEQKEVVQETITQLGARVTRSRAGSTATQQSDAIETIIQPVTTKTSTGVRKKVTFQDLPDNDKENQPLPSLKTKKSAVQKGVTKTTPAASGLRAKPVRGAVTTGTTRARRVNQATKSTTQASNMKPSSKNMPTVLTPKKVTQVAKGGSREEENTEFSDGEDELNGGKTPVRDLSMSPRRPPTSAMAKIMSPVKKLSFEQHLVAASPNKEKGAPEHLGFDRSTIMASPARRPAASPFKDGLKNSPKRGMGESTRLLFPPQSETRGDTTASLALTAGNLSTAAPNMTTLLQSPKRSGAIDIDFSQSAMKTSPSKSSLKLSLMASPAKRLFSPVKKTAHSSNAKISEYETELDTEAVGAASTPVSLQEVTATSHFRASMSPVRVHRMENDMLDLDFDESVLPIGSPLKIGKGTLQQSKAFVSAGKLANDFRGVAQTPFASDLTTAAVDQSSIDPSELEKAPVSLDLMEGAEDNSILTNSRIEGELELTEEAEGTPADATDGDPTVMTQEIDTSLSMEDPHREFHESSEDELAVDITPKRLDQNRESGLRSSTAFSRQSVGISSDTASKGYGFTPLAAQMSGWLASSPKKTPKSRASGLRRVGSFEFTPVAAQHIDGEVMISRDSTPVQKLSTRSLINHDSGKKNRTSLGLRKSLIQHPSSNASPLHQSTSGLSSADNQQFDEYMEVQALNDSTILNVREADVANLVNDNVEFEHIMSLEASESEIAEQSADDTMVVHENVEEAEPAQSTSAELTTDLINFTHASDTAIVDFQKLAEEAEQLAAVEPSAQQSAFATEVEIVPVADLIDGEEANGSSEDGIYGDENELPEGVALEMIAPPLQSHAIVEQFPLPENISSPILQPTMHGTVSPSILDIENAHTVSDPQEANEEAYEQESLNTLLVTPVQSNFRMDKSRVVNTIVSKVPLKPEGYISPIKVQRKRARSFGNELEGSSKRLSLGGLKQLKIPTAEVDQRSPDRRQRTSVAPSPGGTSTPAARSSRLSFGGQSTFTTPGQMSFAIDDFGNSTLDGIELPEDFTLATVAPEDSGFATPAVSEKTYGLASMMATPTALVQMTPATSKRSARRVTAPTPIAKSPARAKNTPKRNSMNAVHERTPLKPMGKGVLDGAIVFVDVHTSEGADASGIFIELLTQMGAKCVKEWRWNPRTSLAITSDAQQLETNIGITHVVYKDGGKRTLEKVRDAKGEVCCVGVAWVLDCERESKWLDESTYAVDTSLMPRGGSRRRKSMEPRALLNSGNGSLSTSKPRRSVSAEMTETMKRELVNTPVRGREPQQVSRTDDDDEDQEDVQVATPTGFIAYDPRTAMTPGTPYLANQGKNLVQMSAPPKQTGKRIFEDENDENDGGEDAYTSQGMRDVNGDRSVSDAKKFKMKNLDMKSRRRTLGFKPLIGSPLSRTERN